MSGSREHERPGPSDETPTYARGRGRRWSLGVLIRQWEIVRTHLVWGWRLHSLGKRTVLCRCCVLNNPRAVALGSYVKIHNDFILADLCPADREYPKIVIGDGTMAMFRLQCNAARSVRIGRNVLIASNVLITDSDHVVDPDGLPVTRNAKFVTRPVTIEDNCWLGQNAVCLLYTSPSPRDS